MYGEVPSDDLAASIHNYLHRAKAGEELPKGPIDPADQDEAVWLLSLMEGVLRDVLSTFGPYRHELTSLWKPSGLALLITIIHCAEHMDDDAVLGRIEWSDLSPLQLGIYRGKYEKWQGEVAGMVDSHMRAFLNLPLPPNTV